MDPIHSLAVVKSIAEKAVKTARQQVLPGVYNVDLTIQIKGIVKVGEDTERTPTVSIPHKVVMALFLKRMGAIAPATAEMFVRCMNEAIAANGKAEEAFAAEIEGMDAIVDKYIEPLLSRLKKTPVKGTVTTDLSVLELDPPRKQIPCKVLDAA